MDIPLLHLIVKNLLHIFQDNKKLMLFHKNGNYHHMVNFHHYLHHPLYF